MCIEVGNFTAEKQQDGTFLYKAKEENLLIKPKPIYKDKPQFPVIYKMEDSFKEAGKKMITNSIEQIIKKISK